MKFWLSIILLITNSILFSQNPCYINGDDLSFTSQDEIDNFIIDHPNCTHTVGDLWIAGEDIVNLDGLSNIVHVGGALAFGSTNPNFPLYLHDFSGLSNIDSVHGSISFIDLDSLESFNGLDNIGPNIGSLIIISVDGITNLNGLEDIECIYSDVRIEENLNLLNFEGLNNLDSIRRPYQMYSNDDFIIRNNPSLENFHGLDDVKIIGGEIKVEDCESLINFEGLDELEKAGELKIYNNSSLESLEGLGGLERINGKLSVEGNEMLHSFEGLNSLVYVWDLNQVDMLNFEGLESLTTIESSLWCGENNTIENFIGLDNLETIGMDFIILESESLINFQGLNSLDSIGGELWIHDCSVLESFDGFEQLSSLNSIWVYDNVTLNNIDGLSGLDWADLDQINIYNNPNLEYCALDFICYYMNYNEEGFLNINNDGAQCDDVYLLNNNCVFGSCLSEGIEFTSQEQIDNFTSNAGYCDEIEGDVVVSGNDISNLDGLFSIRKIWGSLSIQNNPNLIDVSGLRFLDRVGGNTKINNNTVLKSFSGLEDLESIGGSLIIEDNSGLESLEGLNNLQIISGGLELMNNNSLTSIMALTSLSSIEGDLKIQGNSFIESLKGIRNIAYSGISNMYITDNANLSTCDYESVCDYVSDPIGILSISNNASECNSTEEIIEACEYGYCYINGVSFSDQNSINGFPFSNCDVIEGNVIFTGNNVFSLDSLYSVVKIEGNLEFDYAFEIESLEGLNNLYEIEGNLIVGGASIENFVGMDNLSKVNTIDINYASNLQSLDGFENIIHLKGSLGIGNFLDTYYVPILNDLQGLSNLEVIEGGLIVAKTPMLNLQGLNSLVKIGGILRIYANPYLVSLGGLENVETVDGMIWINQNYQLQDLSSLNLVDSIRGGLRIWDNYSLESLEGLNNIEMIGEELSINDNQSLVDISSLNLVNVDSLIKLHIVNNAQLAICDAQSICDYISLSIGEINISDNAEGCSSLEEVILNCDGCYPGGIQFTHQSQIDSFATITQDCSVIWGDLIISGANIVNLLPLSSIEMVLGDLIIENNTNLQSLSGLNGIVSINNNALIIYNNPELSSLTGLSNLTDSYFSYLEILDNENLNYCSTSSICSHFSEYGDYLVNNNNGDCYNSYELVLSCDLLNEEDSPFQLFPNPTDDLLHIASIINSEAEQLTIYDQLGAPVYYSENPDNFIDLSSFDPGIYVAEILSEGIFYQHLLLVY